MKFSPEVLETCSWNPCCKNLNLPEPRPCWKAIETWGNALNHVNQLKAIDCCLMKFWLLAMGHDFARFKEVAHEVQFCVQKQLQTNSSGVEFPRASELVALIFHRKRNGPAKAVLLLRWALFIFKVQCQGKYHETAEKIKTRAPQLIGIKVRLPHDVPKSLAPIHNKTSTFSRHVSDFCIQLILVWMQAHLLSSIPKL